MITTAEPVLEKVSSELNEQTDDFSEKRIRYFNTSVKHILSLYKWAWSRKKTTITLTSSTEYDLTTLISDYNVSWGLHSVEDANGKTIGSIDFSERKEFSSAYMTLTPDNKKLVLTTGFSAGTVLTIWYYAEHQDVAAHTSTLNISIPYSVEEALLLYIQYKVHKGKRQRYDWRNALLDFKEQIDQLRLQEASNKARNKPRIVPNFRAQFGLTRKYR